MIFTSFEFIVFFIIVIISKLLLQNKLSNKTNIVFLLLINYVFYYFWNIKYLILLIVFTVVIYICSRNIKNDLFYYFGIIFSIAYLCYFKYFNFFLETFKFDALNIMLPIGISFYTFEAISYLVDIRKEKVDAEKDFIVFSAYISFFPNIVSGPIARASNLLIQIKQNKKINDESLKTGVQIIAIGFFKKVVLADRIGVFVNDVFARPTSFNWQTTLLAVLSYSLQIYFDFSGYSDIAIGCAKCLGYDLNENFHMPYLSSSITEFWRRWHISLSFWFKDYVYIPLGGNRKGIYRQLLNLIIVMTLSGLWHGANWNYVLWGFINGILLCIEKIFISNKSSYIRMFFTFILISFTWVIFRAETFTDVILIYRTIFTLKEGISQPYLWSFFAFVVFIVFSILIRNSNKKNNQNSTYLLQDLSTIKGLTLLFILIGLIICFAYTNTSPFVYLQF